MPESSLIAHWPLRGDAKDASGKNHGRPQNVAFGKGPDGSAGSAALFNGIDSMIEVPDDESIRLGNADFTISAWVKCEKPMRGVFGDVLSKFGPSIRCGVNLQIAGSSPAYNSMSDTRHVHFGIDDGYQGPWEDCGKPWPSNTLISCLIVFDGELYCGTTDADDPQDAARVFRYAGSKKWIDCGRLGDDPKVLSVQSMLVHDGKLYAGTGVWDWVRAQGGNGYEISPTRVYVYEGGTEWRDLGQVGDGSRVLCLGSFDGELYAGIDRVGEGKCFKYDGSDWIDCGAPDGRNLECFLPLGGTLYVSTHGNIYEYEGDQDWKSIGQCPFDINQIYTMQVADGKIWIGTWPQGYVLRYEGDGNWVNTGRLGIPEGLREINEINDLTVYNGKLYAGVIPKAQVYRYESDGHWTLLRSLATRPDWAEGNTPSWNRVTSITSFQGRLFACTGACQGRAIDVDPEETLGRVYSIQAGQVVSHERDLGDAWTHITAIRCDQQLDLFINGERSASSLAAEGYSFDLTNTRPLLIGYGAQAHFRGAIADLRIYREALAEEEVARLGTPSAD